MENYYQLGSYTRPITTSSVDAQRWFDRGLIWCYGFNHEEAERCFERALEYDPECAMAYWGIGYVNGPFYNKPWEFYGPLERPKSLQRSFSAAREARRLGSACSAVEIGLIEALCSRYPAEQERPIEEMHGWDDAYAAAMRELYARFRMTWMSSLCLPKP